MPTNQIALFILVCVSLIIGTLARVRRRLSVPGRSPAPTDDHIEETRRPHPVHATLALGAILVLLAAGVISSSTDGSAGTIITVPASEDTYVKNTRPDDNFGSRSRLEADTSPSLKRTLLRFPVSGIPAGATVTAAKLRLFVVDSSPKAGTVSRVSGAWSEASVTWANSPQVGQQVVEMLGRAPRGTWREAEVKDAVAGNGTYDFYVTTSSWDGVDYSSSESFSPPNLVVEWQAAATSTPSPASPAPSQAPSPSPSTVPAPTPVPTPTPAPTPYPTGTAAPGGSAVLVGAGDISACNNSGDETTAALLDNIPGTVFTTGDNVYESGTATEFANCYGPSWGRHKARTRPSVGNHEYGTAGATGYYNYFGANAGDPSKGYYSYNLGSWHIIALNSNCSAVGGCGAGSAQEKWLRADLAANPTACTAAYWHHPRFSSGQHGGSTSTLALWQALYDNNADVVLVGHDHHYERFAPQDPAGTYDAARGIREFVVGSGGKSHYATGTPKPNSEVRNSDTYGVLKLTLKTTSYDWQFVPVAGQTFTDSGTANCVGANSVSAPQPIPTAAPTAAPAPAGSALVSMVEDVTSATAYRYLTRDSVGNTMDTLKVIEGSPSRYLGVYHTLSGGVFRVKVATSTDLLSWTYRADLDEYASQPTISRLSDGSFVVAYEKGSGGAVKCEGMGVTGNECLYFRHYADESNLFSASFDREFKVTRALSACAEGTPNIYSATLSPDIDHSTIEIGFHYFRNCDVDRQARGTLTNFNSWSAQVETHVNDLFQAWTPTLGGNVGDREFAVFGGTPFALVEAQYTKADWASWRVFIHDQQSHSVAQLNVKTHKGSTAFGNPSVTMLTSPNGRPAMFVTYFVFTQGSAPGEEGELVFYREY